MRFILAVCLAFMLLIPGTQALTTPDVMFIPSKLSPGSSLIAVVTGDSDIPVRIEWNVPEADAFGIFPKMGEKFYCYFSNSDPDAFCGPTPFTVSTGLTPYNLLLESNDAMGSKETNTVPVDVGGLTFTTSIEIIEDAIDLTVFVAGGLPNSVSYEVYDKNNLSLIVPTTQLIDAPFSDAFLANITLPGGDYFLALTAFSSDDFGGNLVPVSIPTSGGDGTCTDDPGDYPLKAENLYSLGVLIGKGEDYTKTGTELKITNLGDSPVDNITVNVPLDLRSMLDVELLSYSLDVNDSTFYTVKLSNMEDSVTINTVVELVSGDVVVGKISINIPVTVIGGGDYVCPGTGALTIQPAVLSGNFLMDSSTSRSFTLTNNGDTSLSSLTYSMSGTVEDIATVTLPPTVPASGTGTVIVSLDPTFTGNYDGSITITADGNTAVILVNTNFFKDISDDISSLQDQLDSLKIGMTSDQLLFLSGILDDIETFLSNADNSFTFESYQEAELALAKAEASLSTLSDSLEVLGTTTTTEEGFDFTIIIIIVVIIAAGAGVFLFLRRRAERSSSEEEFEDEFEEEIAGGE